MLTQSSATTLQLEKLKVHLKTERYGARIQQRYPPLAKHFLRHLERKAVAIRDVSQSDVDSFLRLQYKNFCERHGRALPFRRWGYRYTAAVHMLLRLAHGKWPVEPDPTTALEVFHNEIVRDYDAWMRDLRGLQPITRAKRVKNARHFLAALGLQGCRKGLVRLGVPEIDAYVRQRCIGIGRLAIEDRTVCLRDFLRHLHRSRRTAVDLSRIVIGPRIYEYERIPSALKSEHVKGMLKITGQDHSPRGLRDYALLILLATYGLRGTELVRLRLDDIDWKCEILRVRHWKTGAASEFPLVGGAGEAVLRYLQKGRPQTTHREVFLRMRAPYRPYATGSAVAIIIHARLQALGIRPESRRGANAFRHAVAVSLLRNTVPFKIIGDILGHRSPRSTGAYLKLATNDLRAIGLELPTEAAL